MKKLTIDGIEIEVPKFKWTVEQDTFGSKYTFDIDCLDIRFDLESLLIFLSIFYEKNTYVISDGKKRAEFFMPCTQISKMQKFLKGENRTGVNLKFTGTLNEI